MRGFRVVGSTDAVWLIITTPFFATLRARSGYDSGQGGRLSRHERFQSGTDSRAWRAADTGSLSALWSGVGNRVGQAITQENNLTAPLRMTRISWPCWPGHRGTTAALLAVMEHKLNSPDVTRPLKTPGICSFLAIDGGQ